jgi:hypothetical protein
MRWALLLVALVGCEADSRYCDKPYAYKQRVEQVWAQHYAAGECPCVEWVPQAALDCFRWGAGVADWEPAVNGLANGWIADHTTLGRSCVFGLNDPLNSWVKVIDVDDVAHELAHQWLWRRGGDGDPEHELFVWRPGETVSRATAALLAAGVKRP